MTTHQFTAAPRGSTDTEFRNWVGAVIDALTAVGLVRTADTGQLDVATVTAPTAGGTEAGYAIFRFDDSLQSEYPIFIRLGFGSKSTGNNSNPQVWLTLGKGTDGAGDITGVLIARTNLANSVSSTGSTSLFPGVASAGEGYVAMVPFLGYGVATVLTPWFIIERSPSGDAVYMVSRAGLAGGGGTLSSATSALSLSSLLAVNYANGQQSISILPVVVPYSVNGVPLGTTMSLASGALGPVFPWVAFAPAAAPVQLTAGVTYPGGDVPGAAFTAIVGGEERTFYPIPITASHSAMGAAIDPYGTNANSNNSTYLGFAIRWE